MLKGLARFGEVKTTGPALLELLNANELFNEMIFAIFISFRENL